MPLSWSSRLASAALLALAALALAVALVPSATAQSTQCTTMSGGNYHGSGIKVMNVGCGVNAGPPSYNGADAVRLGGWTEGTNLITSFEVNEPFNAAAHPSDVATAVWYQASIGVGTNGAGGSSAGTCYFNGDNGWQSSNGDTLSYTASAGPPPSGAAAIYKDSGCAGGGLLQGSMSYRWQKFRGYYCNEMDVIYPEAVIGVASGSVVQWTPSQANTNAGLAIEYTAEASSGNLIDDTGYSTASFTVGTTTFNLVPAAPTATVTVSGTTVTITINRGTDNGVELPFGYYIYEGATQLNTNPLNRATYPSYYAPGAVASNWDSSALTYTISGVSVGTHTYTVKEANCRGESPGATVTATVVAPLSCSPPSTSGVAIGGSVSLTASGGTTPYNWAFVGTPVGSPSTFTGSPFVPTFPSSGTYTIRVTDASSPAQTATCTVSVSTPPPPPPTCSPGTVSLMVGTTQTFTAGGGSGSYSWTTTGGASPPTQASGSTFVTQWPSAGTFTVTVNSNGATAVCNVTITTTPPPPPPPVLGCSPGTSALSLGGSATFTASNAGSSVSWSAPGADTSSGTGTTFTTSFSSTGTFQVTVTSSGQTATCNVTVTATCGSATADFEPSSATPEVGQAVSFSDLSHPQAALTSARLWDFGDGGSANETSPSHTYTQPGTFHVHLTVVERGSNCASTADRTITVQAPSSSAPSTPNGGSSGGGGGGVSLPVADAGGDQAVREGTNVTLHGTSSDPGAHLTWRLAQTSGGDVPTSGSGSDLTFVAPMLADPSQPLVYVYELVATNGAGNSPPSSARITVGPADLRPIADAGPDADAIAGAVVTLDGTASHDPEGKALTYAWEHLAGLPITLSAPTAAKPTFVAPAGADGSVDFKLTVSDGRWSATDSVRVWIKPAPAPTGGIVATRGTDGAFAFTAPTASTYAWDFGDNTTSSAAAPTHTYAKAGAYNVRLVTQDASGQHTFQTPVTALPAKSTPQENAVSATAGWVWPALIGGMVLVLALAVVGVALLVRAKRNGKAADGPSDPSS